MSLWPRSLLMTMRNLPLALNLMTPLYHLMVPIFENVTASFFITRSRITCMTARVTSRTRL